MASYWDRTDAKRARIEDRKRTLREKQLEMWGWCDMRERDYRGRVVKPRKPRRDAPEVAQRSRGRVV